MATRIYNDDVYHYTMSEIEDGKWFRVKFYDDGKANFWLHPEDSKHDVDLYIYEDEDRDSERLGRSSKGAGRDDIVRDIPVRAGRYYYIYVRNYNKRAGEIQIKAKVYEESGSKHDSRIGRTSNWRVKDDSPTEIYCRRNIDDPFDYLKVFLDGKQRATLRKGRTYRGSDGEDFQLRGDGWEYEYLIGGLSPNTTHEIKVIPYKGSPYDDNSDYGDTYKGSATTTFTPPSNVEVVKLEGRTITLDYDRGKYNDKVEVHHFNGGKIIDAPTSGPITIDLGEYGYEWDKKYTLKLRGVSKKGRNTDFVNTPRIEIKSKPKEGLKKGDKGSAVKGMQELLYYLGYLAPKSQIDSDFGKNTEAAVMNYQRAIGITVDGIIDDTTRSRLASSARSSYEAQANSRPTVQVASKVFSQEEQVKSINYNKMSYWSGRVLEDKYETVGWGIGINLDYIVNTASVMSIQYDKSKISPSAIEQLEDESQKEGHTLDWNKPFIYGAGGFSFSQNVFADAAKAGMRFLENPDKFKFRKQVPSGNAVIIQVMKLKTNEKFNPNDITELGKCVGGSYGYFTGNTSETAGGKVLVICYGASTPGISVSLSQTETALIKKSTSDKWFEQNTQPFSIGSEFMVFAP